MPNGIDLVLADHRTVEALFASFNETGDASYVGLTIDALKAHDEAEHAALYRLIAVVVGDADMIERARIAHSMIKKQIEVLGSLEGPALVEAFGVLQALVTDHVGDEERNLLPALAAGASDQQLEGLGARILQAKQRVG